MLEKQQQKMLGREQKQRQVFSCIMYAIAVYLVFFAVCFIERFFFHELDVLFGKEIFFAEFLIATAVVVFICAKKLGKKQE